MSVPSQPPPALPAAPDPPRLRGVWLTMVLAVLVFAALALASDLAALEASLAQFRASALLSALALVMGNYVLRFLRWKPERSL